MPPPGLDQLKHIVVLMMENRSFDHLLGFLKAQDGRIDGLTGHETNPDTTGAPCAVTTDAKYQSQLQPDPGHHYGDVDIQIFGRPRSDHPTMQGFVQSYFEKCQDVDDSHRIMCCFRPEKVPVIAALARHYALFNRWFSSIPGPTIPNRAFAHFGTSFGKVDMSLLYLGEKYKTVYERFVANGRTAKIYYYDQQSGTIALTFMLTQQPQLFATFDQFQKDCANGTLPDYSFVEPNYTDHSTGAGTVLASDQHPDNNVLAGEEFIAAIYTTIVANRALWESTALLIVYDEHGGLYDHVAPPACTPDEFQDPTTGFKFDRLGIRVPAVLVSPWVPAGTIVDRTFDHASIPATVTKRFLPGYSAGRSPRETSADTFLDLLTLATPRQDELGFQLPGAAVPRAVGARAVPIERAPRKAVVGDRPLSILVQDHVKMVHAAELTLPKDRQTGTDISTITTEKQASDYIARVMAMAHAPARPARRAGAARKRKAPAARGAGRPARGKARTARQRKAAGARRPAAGAARQGRSAGTRGARRRKPAKKQGK